MRLATLFLTILLTLGLALGQAYQPKPGETVMKLAIEGRGDVYILLHTKEAPKTCEHIEALVRAHFFDGQRFYKVIKTPKPYLVQTGDPVSRTGDLDDPSMGTHGSGAAVPYEDTGFSNVRGAVGLGTIQDQKNTGDSQFYIMLSPAKFLDGSYTVFGQVVKGMDVVDKVERGDRITSAVLLTG